MRKYLPLMMVVMALAAGAQETPAPRLLDIRVEVLAQRIEVRLIGEGALPYETFWLSRPSGEIYVIDLPGVFLAQPISVDLTSSGDTSVPWKAWPLRNVRAVQMSGGDTMTGGAGTVRVTVGFSPLGGGGFRPDVRIAEGVSQLVLTVARSAEPLSVVPTAATELSSPMPVPDAPGRRISIRFRDAELAEVLHTLADQSRMNLVVDPKVAGKVTIRLEDVTLEEALAALLKGTGFGWIIDGNLLRIVPDRFTPETRLVIPVGEARSEDLLTLLRTYASQPSLLVFDPQSNSIVYTASQPGEAEMLRALTSEMRRRDNERPLDGEGRSYISTVPLLYAEPDDVAKLVQTMLSSENIIVTPDVRSHALLVRAPNRATLSRVISFVQSVDKPTPQVLLKVRIIETTVNTSDVLGVEWSSSMSFSVSPVSMPTKFPLRPDAFGNGPDVPGDGISAGTLSTSGLTATLRFLESNGKSTVLSAPEILVIDREPAEIIVGSREPIRTTTTSNGVVSENVEFVDVGVVLRVTPIVLPGNRVMLTAHPENSSASASEIAGVPRISTSEATTRILVDNERTAVIGGLYSESKSEEDQGIPFLGRLPLIGKLFRSDNKSISRRNLMVFITPYILGTDGATSPSFPIESPDASQMGRWVQELRDVDRDWHNSVATETAVGAIPAGSMRP